MQLAADANVLLSTVLGGRARLVLESPQIDEICLTFNVPIWSNDQDFEGTGVAWLTTEALLGQLGL